MNVAVSSPTSSLTVQPIASIEALFSRAYGAQLSWREAKLKNRLAIIKKFRAILVRDRKLLSASIQIPGRQNYAETISSEIMPLADAVAWLERRAQKVLAPRYCQRRHTPFWLGLLESSVQRVPYGLVLIIGAGNYPIFLTGVQVLQALVAGNAVAIKPAPGTEAVTQHMVRLLVESGVPAELLVELDSGIDAAQQAIEVGVDKVVMTGSSRSGRSVLRQLADSLTPSTMELSGCDAVYVLPGADMHRVCDNLIFGMRLNGGASCLAPRRVFVPVKVSEVFHRLLAERLQRSEQKAWRTNLVPATCLTLQTGIEEALRLGARFFESPASSIAFESRQLSNTSGVNGNTPKAGTTISVGHFVLTDMKPTMKLCSADVFAPLSMIIPVMDWAEAIQFDSMCPYALTASIYGPIEDALRLTKFVSAGSITINDTLVPTADPQLPFGGRGESGFGVTRGDEGLLEMTVPKVITIRRGTWLPHLQPQTTASESLLDGLLQWRHAGSWMDRLRGMQQTIRAAMASRKKFQGKD